MGSSQILGGHVAERPTKSGDEQVQPPVVVVVKEPRRKTHGWSFNTRLCRHIPEHPGAICGRPLVVKETIWLLRQQVGHIQVEPAVVVVVAPDDTLDKAHHGDPRVCRDIRKRSVAVVVEQLTWVGRTLDGLGSDEQINPAVVVVITPRRRLSRGRGQQTGFHGDIRKRTVAVVSQQRVRMPFVQPRATQDQHVEPPVVVVVGMDEIETTDHSFQPGVLSHIRKGSVAIVAEMPELVTQPS